MSYALHPLCTLFPRLEGDAFDALVADIRANGLREPIILLDDMILDGGNRYRACLESGVKASFEQYRGDNAAAFVISRNLHRRHLTAAQRSAVVTAVADFTKAHPAHRIAAKHKEGGTNTTFSTLEERAAAAEVSKTTQQKTERVHKADPEMTMKVARGEVTLTEALAKTKPRKPPNPTQPTPDEGAPVETDADIIQNLRAELATMAETLAQVSAELDAYRIAQDGEAAAKEIQVLQRKLELSNQARDQWMATCGELRKEVAALKRKLGK